MLIQLSLNDVGSKLRLETEREMMVLRKLIGESANKAAIEKQAARVASLLAENTILGPAQG